MPWSSAQPYRLTLLGPWDLRGPDDERLGSVLSQPKRLCLLAYLSVVGRPVSRASLVALFWPESDEDRARNALSQSVFHLRRSLSKAAIESVEGDRLYVPAELVQCDVRRFLQGHNEPARPMNGFDVDAARRIEQGAEFFEGWNADDTQELQDWVDGVRRRVRERADAVLAAEPEEGGGSALSAVGASASRPDPNQGGPARPSAESTAAAGSIPADGVPLGVGSEAGEPSAEGSGISDASGEGSGISDASGGGSGISDASGGGSDVGDAGAGRSANGDRNRQGPQPSPASPSVSFQEAAKATLRKPWLIALLGVTAVALAIYLATQGLPGDASPTERPAGSASAGTARPRPPVTDPRPVVAVLMPRVTATGEAPPRLANAVQDEILAALDRVDGIRSIPFSSIDPAALERFLGDQSPLPDSTVTTDVSLDWVIVVNLRVAGNRVRAIPQFRDGSESHQDWFPEGMDYEAADPAEALLELPQQIALSVVGRFEGWIAREQSTPPPAENR